MGAALTGFGFALVFPALGVEAFQRVPSSSRGAAMGVFSVFLDVALGATGPLAGLLVGVYGYASIFLIAAVAAVAGGGNHGRPGRAAGAAKRLTRRLHESALWISAAPRLPPAMLNAVLTTAIWVKACGKLPSCRFSCGEYSSASSPRSLERPSSRSNRALASSMRP